MDQVTVGAVWASICIAAVAVLALAAGRIGRLKAAAWMLVVAALLLAEEDRWQLVFMASTPASGTDDGVLPKATEGSAGLAWRPASPSGPSPLPSPVAPFSGGVTTQKKKGFASTGRRAMIRPYRCLRRSSSHGGIGTDDLSY
jgi:hypothetical protein